MSLPNVWSRSREKIRLFPELFAECAGEAAVYGKCVAATTAGRLELKKDLCVGEFDALKSCFTRAAKKKAK
ncbi:NADH dehydrogenase [ubiquinone] 1 alpha subcomplex assembly factor 8 [Brachionichthys hirsutus]|uniref:NADH dehydrogenase [ubiquinone] 1 alpha subcomplex assembly factor 8 n=1 Tax=Brachionichthys hirsutus TaxID=412623 RepID=UPI0036054314